MVSVDMAAGRGSKSSIVAGFISIVAGFMIAIGG
jgi:hypothetical protein